MKLIARYLSPYKWRVLLSLIIKTAGTFAELLIPYVLEYMIDTVAPGGNAGMIFACGGVMLVFSAMIFAFNVIANRLSVETARRASTNVRRDLFWKSINLSGTTFDDFTLPSITSRMTSDSYNVQDFSRMIQTIGIRAPLMLIGGIIVSLIMDTGLGLIISIIAPISLAITIILSFKGIPLYDNVQNSVDELSLIMRENITGIRVVKSLSKEEYEKGRFSDANDIMVRREKKANTVMALPGPIMTLLLNIGLTLVVIVGAYRVNGGVTEPGVILAFLTYFNMILMGTMGIGRVLLTMSKANASARRIQAVIDQPEELIPIAQSEAASTSDPGYIVFEDVTFSYGDDQEKTNDGFAGGRRRSSISDISFSIPKGGSLGILGPTGCGKSTIISLLMRFYDIKQGHIFVDGKDIRSYDLSDLRKRFGIAFQTDMIFADTIEENIRFGRDLDTEQIIKAAEDACASEFIEEYEDGYSHEAAAHGSNFSGGQKQRILIARALAGESEILILDDSSSALDYKTDAQVRKSIRENHSSTSIIVAQRVSSVMSLDQIMVMNDGCIIGLGNHEYLMENCEEYREIYRIQMGKEEE